MAMNSKTKDLPDKSAAAAMKELRARDAVLAMREYQQDKIAVQARTERLRALRLARDSAAAAAPPASAASPKKQSRKKA
jgi:hypothetical protein